MNVTAIREAATPLQAAMFLCFSLMGIYWLQVIQFGGFSLKAFHIGMLCVIAVTFVSFYGVPSILRVVRYCSPWLFAYFAYMIFLLPAVVGRSGFGLWFRQAFFVTSFLCVAAYFSRAPSPAGKLRCGALCGIVLFLFFTEYSARQISKSLIFAVVDFLGSGNFQALIFKFFRPVFNSLEDTTELAFGASLTNSIAGALLVLSVCFRIGYRGPGTDLLGSVITVSILFLAVLLNARSVVLAALASILIAFTIRLVARGSVSLTEILYWIIGLLVLVSVAFVAALQGTSAVDSIATAFQFADNSAESRVEQYRWALALIEEKPLWGHGYLVADSGLPIHNLFLSSWAYVGFVGFALILVFYVGLLYAWLRWMYIATMRIGYWVLPLRLEWVAVLPVLPLLRVWISGAGGHVASAEWIALAVFIGLVIHNDVKRRTANECVGDRALDLSPASSSRYV
jgi:hypothetical protein